MNRRRVIAASVALGSTAAAVRHGRATLQDTPAAAVPLDATTPATSFLVVDAMEQLAGWTVSGSPRPELALSDVHTEGRFSLQVTIPATSGEPAPVFIGRSYAALGTQPQEWDRLEFDYQVRGGSVAWFGVKLGGLPGIDQAVWQLPGGWPAGLADDLAGDLGEWQQAALPLAQPELKWPGAMAQRIELRVVPAAGEPMPARILVDHMRFVKGPAPALTPQTRTAADWRPGRRARPYAFATAEELRLVRGRLARRDWAGAEWNRLRRRAESWLTQPVEVPVEVGGWYHDYVCPDHGVRLAYDPSRPAAHRCPVDGKLWTGERFDAAWRFFRHSELGDATRDLALVYALTDDARFAARARDALLGYAQAYAAYRVGARPGAFQQTLDEAVWLISLAQAYDLIYNAPALVPEQHAAIELDLLRPAAAVVRANDRRESNWQTWHNAALATAAAALEDEALFNDALRGRSGLEFQLERSVLADGFWYEGSFGYHFYALTALLRHLEVARRWGADYYGDPRVRSLFDAPLGSAYPDLTLPANNDGGYGMSLTGQAGLYEVAYARIGDSGYAWLLRQAYTAGRPRGGEWALFQGVETLPEPARPPEATAGRVFEASGLAVLRRPEVPAVPGSAVYVSLDFGPHGGGHGHPDKLHLNLFGAGQPLLADFGTPPYGHRLYPEYYKQTAAHNTVLVDGQSQQPATGELVAFSTLPGKEEIQARANGAYPGVTYARRVRLRQGYVLDEFSVEADASHTYDWLLHPLGVLESTLTPADQPPPADTLGRNGGGQHIALSGRAAATGTWQGVWRQGSAGLRVTLLLSEGAEVLLGEAPGPASNPAIRTSVLVARVTGAAARFLASYEVFTGEAPPVDPATLAALAAAG